jgi:hypothetical protein
MYCQALYPCASFTLFSDCSIRSCYRSGKSHSKGCTLSMCCFEVHNELTVHSLPCWVSGASRRALLTEQIGGLALWGYDYSATKPEQNCFRKVIMRWPVAGAGAEAHIGGGMIRTQHHARSVYAHSGRRDESGEIGSRSNLKGSNSRV